MKRILSIAAIVVSLAAASCGNQNGTTTNSPNSTNADSAANSTDTGMGTINNGTPNNNMDTAQNDSMKNDSNAH